MLISILILLVTVLPVGMKAFEASAKIECI